MLAVKQVPDRTWTLFRSQGQGTLHMLMDLPKPADLHATRVLSLDAGGRILGWISWQDAVCLYVRDAVAWTLGDPCLTVHGGHNRARGSQSLLHLHPIIASTGHCREHAIDPAPRSPTPRCSRATATSACTAASTSPAWN
jgi:hypothetical protein